MDRRDKPPLEALYAGIADNYFGIQDYLLTVTNYKEVRSYFQHKVQEEKV